MALLAHRAGLLDGEDLALQVALNGDRVSPTFAAMMNFNVLATTPSGHRRVHGDVANNRLRAVGMARSAQLGRAGGDQLEAEVAKGTLRCSIAYPT
jgi:hypothetical protein